MQILKSIKPAKLRLYISNKYAYAQIIRSIDGNIVAAASTIESSLKEELKNLSLVDKNACNTYVYIYPRLF